MEFRFRQPENLGVFVCDNVRLRGEPILYVSRDEEGEWQFLCGGDHVDGGADGAALVCLADLVARDESLNELADLCHLGEAQRERQDARWSIHDGMEDAIRRNVAEHGCHVMIVSADDEGAGFAYSIGLTRTYHQPEVICFGLRDEVMHWMINELRARMSQGARFKDGDHVAELIEGYTCILKHVDRTRYREYFGYACWFCEGDSFDALQIVWPDPQARYPWDSGYAAPQAQQPEVWLPARGEPSLAT